MLERQGLMGRKAVYSDASHLEDGGSRLRAHLPLSVQVEVSIRRERGTEQRSREGLEVLCEPTSTVHSGKASDGPVCVTLVSHPGFTLSQRHVILASHHPGSTDEGQQISQSWDA